MRIFTALVAIILLGLASFVVYQTKVYNPEVALELRTQPDGPRAERVMLMTIDDRKTLPVNYLREGDEVYVGADGPWWRDLAEEGRPVTLLIKGQVLEGQARAISKSAQPGFTKEVFERLRPDTPGWMPDWLSGVLVVVYLTEGG